MSTPPTSPLPARFPATASSPHSAKWFAEEIQPHEPQLRNFLRGTYPAVRDLDDVVQESYLRVWKSRATREIRSAKSFLFTVARNIARDLLRRDAKTPVSAVADLAPLQILDEAPSAPEVLGVNERLQWLAEALADLPPRCRQAILLTKCRGMTHREAAETLGLSVKTVDEQVSRGLRRLGAEIGKQKADEFFCR